MTQPNIPPGMPGMPEIPKEALQKLEAMKQKLDKYTKIITKDNKDNNIIGVALLPPSKMDPEEKLSQEEVEKLKKAINVLVVINVADKKDGVKLREHIIKECTSKTKDIDENISPLVMDIIELKENCFDAKYDVLEGIGLGAPLYDPKDVLGAFKISEVHKNMVLRKFEKYVVSYCAVGSMFRGDATSHDIDVYMVIDDTDVKKMTRAELKDKLSAIAISLGHEAAQITGVKKQFHIQTYILTDFWDALKDANPVIYTFLRDAVPLYDRGVFMPWKLLLKMGRIKPSREAIEMQMDIGEKLVLRTKGKMLSILGEDLYYAILNPAQAALMLYGIAPPTPKETIQLMDDVFVKKEKLLEKKYVDILAKIRKYYKDIEYGLVKEVSGKEIDEILKGAEDYLKRIKKLFEQIQARRDKESVDEMHSNIMNALKDALEIHKVKFSEKLAVNLFKKTFVDKRILPARALDALKQVVNAKQNYAKKKMSSGELDKVRRESHTLLKFLVEYIQRKRGYEMERAKIRFKYGDKFGEVILLDKVAFVINDLAAEEKEITKAAIKENGGLASVEKSSLEELEKALVNVKMPNKVFIKEKIFEDLRRLFGQEVEILVNY